MTMDLPYAHGGPPLVAELRREPADFRVEEILGFAPSGSGEHAFVLIEKTAANTEWVARELARRLGLAPVAIGFAGLKDRHAITRQAFTVHLGQRAEPDWQALDIEGVRVLSVARHARKLKRGSHRGNRFEIRLRAPQGERDRAQAVLDAIVAQGVPNYFGEQRFGRDGGNADLARQLFAGARMPRERRGIALSAARSELFNAALAQRVAAGSWNRALDGEVWMLAGTHSVFGPEPLDDALRERLASGDIHPSGPLWGRGELRSTDAVRALELAVADAHAELARGLEAAGLEQQRRALRLLPRELAASWQDDGLAIHFALEAGAFATTVLRELARWH
ncbi:MAG: tRNA pseudouridine(13) synthase TruD [Dokdonella sp.]|nr:tRNA pseudouridine(13) synthase TruD [Dokdonella sp.]